MSCGFSVALAKEENTANNHLLKFSLRLQTGHRHGNTYVKGCFCRVNWRTRLLGTGLFHPNSPNLTLIALGRDAEPNIGHAGASPSPSLNPNPNPNLGLDLDLDLDLDRNPSPKKQTRL